MKMKNIERAERKIRIAVLVSGGGTNLQALIDAVSAGNLTSGKIVAVISNKPGAYALTRAEKAGIPAKVVESRGRSQAEFEKGLTAALEEAGAEIIVLAGFLRILSPEFTRKYEKRIINIHPALIPSFCGEGFYGLRVHEAALAKGVKVTGATVHFVNEIPDGGEIIDQEPIRVEEGDTPEILQRRVMEQAEWRILPRAVEKVCASLLARGQG